jgi:hypothetical protein
MASPITQLPNHPIAQSPNPITNRQSSITNEKGPPVSQRAFA